MDTTTINLRPRSDCSFELVSGTGKPIDLATWLMAQGFSCTLVLTHPQHHRLERPAPARERVIVLIFQSGTALVQGHPQPREETIELLKSLVVEMQPEAVQEVLL